MILKHQELTGSRPNYIKLGPRAYDKLRRELSSKSEREVVPTRFQGLRIILTHHENLGVGE